MGNSTEKALTRRWELRGTWSVGALHPLCCLNYPMMVFREWSLILIHYFPVNMGNSQQKRTSASLQTASDLCIQLPHTELSWESKTPHSIPAGKCTALKPCNHCPLLTYNIYPGAAHSVIEARSKSISAWISVSMDIVAGSLVALLISLLQKSLNKQLVIFIGLWYQCVFSIAQEVHWRRCVKMIQLFWKIFPSPRTFGFASHLSKESLFCLYSHLLPEATGMSFD